TIHERLEFSDRRDRTTLRQAVPASRAAWLARAPGGTRRRRRARPPAVRVSLDHGRRHRGELHAHEFSVALNTARSLADVKDYCGSYSLAGGVAEHGSYIWDAVARRGRALVSPDAMRQLAELKAALERIPGVFLDDRHQYSIRAFTYRNKRTGLIASLMDP